MHVGQLRRGGENVRLGELEGGEQAGRFGLLLLQRLLDLGVELDLAVLDLLGHVLDCEPKLLENSNNKKEGETK